ncbi:MAG: hypothetical protein AMXMBFR64_23690 [Myxococcales bacterium]
MAESTRKSAVTVVDARRLHGVLLVEVSGDVNLHVGDVLIDDDGGRHPVTAIGFCSLANLSRGTWQIQLSGPVPTSGAKLTLP